jgi:hypothetical protein
MIDVVNLFTTEQPTTDVLFHHPSVLQHVPAIRRLDLAVPRLELSVRFARVLREPTAAA